MTGDVAIYRNNSTKLLQEQHTVCYLHFEFKNKNKNKFINDTTSRLVPR